MSKTPELELAGRDLVARPGGNPEGDGLRHLTHALLALYLAPAVCLVLLVGGVMAVVVKGVELATRVIDAMRPVTPPAWVPPARPIGARQSRTGRLPHGQSVTRASLRSGSVPRE
jgi:hypothetical protein